MNSDVYLEPGDLEALQAALEAHPRAAMAGPTLYTPQGRLQSFGPLYAPNYWNLRRPRAVGWVSGALIMVRKSALQEIGGMDERFFFYNEDLEWCTRARRKGWQVLLVPRRVLHLGGEPTPKTPALSPRATGAACCSHRITTHTCMGCTEKRSGSRPICVSGSIPISCSGRGTGRLQKC